MSPKPTSEQLHRLFQLQQAEAMGTPGGVRIRPYRGWRARAGAVEVVVLGKVVPVGTHWASVADATRALPDIRALLLAEPGSDAHRGALYRLGISEGDDPRIRTWL